MSINPAKIQKDLVKFAASSKLDNPAELKSALDKSMQALSVLLEKKDVKDRQNRYVCFSLLNLCFCFFPYAPIFFGFV